MFSQHVQQPMCTLNELFTESPPPEVTPKPALVIFCILRSLFSPAIQSSAESEGSPAKQGGKMSSWNIEDY